jgi:hypothetical protein
MISTHGEPPYTCVYCNREYKLEENYKRHYICCEFFHKTRKERCQERAEVENMPTQKELVCIVRDLVIQVNELKREVRSLKSATANRTRKEVVEYLNLLTTPVTTFKSWIASQSIEFSHLECVFEYSLTEGLKMCIEDHLQLNTKDEANLQRNAKETKEYLKSIQLPICAFESKPNQFYIYDMSGTVSSWKRMESDLFERWISTLSHKFLQYFIEWQTDNLPTMASEKDKEDNILYMIKVNGGRNPSLDKEKRIAELKKWLFSKIQVRISSLVEIE